MKNTIRKNKFLFYFFLLIFVYNLFQILEYGFDKYSFQYGDWLINYSNGFVRRGLVGEFFLLIENIFKLSLQNTYIFFVIFLLSIFYLKSFELLKKIKLNTIFLFLIFSPFLYLFTVLNHASGIRKEYLLILLFIFFVADLLKRNYQNIKLKYIILFQVVLLSHELAIFFLPFFILLSLLKKYKSDFFKSVTDVAIFVFFSVLTTLFLYIFKGNETYVIKICDSLGVSVYNNCYNSGAIKESFSQTIPSIFKTIVSMYDIKGILLFFLMFAVYLLPFLFFILKNLKFGKFFIFNIQITKKIFFFIIFLCFIFSLPLFFIGADWGRWFSIFFFFIFYLIIFLIIKRFLIIRKNFKSIEFIKNKTLKKIIIILFIIFYSSFATPGVFYEKNTYEKAIKFNYISLINKIN